MDSTTQGAFTVEKLKTFVKALIDVLNVKSLGEKVLSDLKESWWIILLGVLLACFVSLFWIIMMRFMAAVMVWASIILSIGLLGKSFEFAEPIRPQQHIQLQV